MRENRGNLWVIRGKFNFCMKCLCEVAGLMFLFGVEHVLMWIRRKTYKIKVHPVTCRKRMQRPFFIGKGMNLVNSIVGTWNNGYKLNN